MKHIFIVNPNAGKHKHVKELCESISEVAERLGVEFQILMPPTKEDGPRMIDEIANGIEDTVRFYACGGDGTLNRVANAVIKHSNAEVALLPFGTGNDFMRNFSEKANFYDIEKQINGTAEKIDTILCNEQYCVNMINIGFDCDVVARAEEFRSRFPFASPFAYSAGVVRTLFKDYGTKMKITFPDGEVIDKELLLTAIGNGGYCGGGYHSNPKAVLTDSLFDLCLVNKVSRPTFIRLIGSYKKGTHLETKIGKDVIVYRQLDRLSMQFESEIGICIDGEIFSSDHADLSICPKSLSFSIPEGSFYCPYQESTSDMSEA